jgi:hypothetical protein
MQEVWKDVLGYEGYYQVSNKGNIKSFYRYDRKSTSYIKDEHIQKSYDSPANHNQNYRVVALSAPNRRGAIGVHRLVGQAFIPNLQNKPQINHIDSAPSNNNVSNLEWVTQKENAEHGVLFGRNAIKRKKWKDEQLIDKVVELYSSGMGAEKVGREVKAPINRVLEMLKSRNIRRRTLEEARAIRKVK